MTQRARVSPVLGYNHNLRHGGRVFHVQTEDSGQGYARLHTHLFYEGTILSTKKQEYDPSAPEDAVRALMQQLHKSMIRELSHGEHDPRIGAFFAARGEPARLDAPAAAVAPAAAPVVAETAVAPAQPELPAAPVARAAALPTTSPMMAAASPKPVVMVKPGAVRRPPVVLSSSADGVVVRRNVVINVGGGAPPVNGTTGGAQPPAGGRARAAAPVAASDGAVVKGKGASRAAVAPDAAPQPLASSRDIRMPWESPAPPRAAQQPIVAAAPTRRQSSGDVKMPWDGPEGARPSSPETDAFAAALGDDKGLDEVILEYLSDDSEPEER
jgi:hypothetical protein